MKTQYLFPILAAAIGFSVAWVVKPAPQQTQAVPTEKTAAGKTPTRPDNTRTRPSAASEKRPKEVDAGEFPLVDLAEKGPKTRTEAKMLRLSEALGLTIEQQGSIISAVEDAKGNASDAVPVIQDMATRGKALEDALGKILSPEQLAKFEEIRVRERENRVEARAQRSLSQLIDEIDLSPGQRDEVLSRLRQYAREQIQSIPASAALLLNSSLLPTDGGDLNLDAVLALTRAMEEPPSPDDPMKAHETIIRRQREELEAQLRCFDGILTSAQMGQVYAAIAEREAKLEQLRNAAPPKPIPNASTPPEAAPAPDPNPPRLMPEEDDDIGIDEE